MTRIRTKHTGVIIIITPQKVHGSYVPAPRIFGAPAIPGAGYEQLIIYQRIHVLMDQ